MILFIHSFIHFKKNYLCIWVHQVSVAANGMWFPDQGWNPDTLYWKCAVLVTDHQCFYSVWIYRIYTRPLDSCPSTYRETLRVFMLSCFSHLWMNHLCDPVDCSPPGSSWDSPGENTGVACHALLQGTFLTQRWNLQLPKCRQIFLPLSHWGGWWRTSAPGHLPSVYWTPELQHLSTPWDTRCSSTTKRKADPVSEPVSRKGKEPLYVFWCSPDLVSLSRDMGTFHPIKAVSWDGYHCYFIRHRTAWLD